MTKAEILALTGLTEDQFYNLYPTPESFKMAYGGMLKNGGERYPQQPPINEIFSYGTKPIGLPMFMQTAGQVPIGSQVNMANILNTSNRQLNNSDANSKTDFNSYGRVIDMYGNGMPNDTSWVYGNPNEMTFFSTKVDPETGQKAQSSFSNGMFKKLTDNDMFNYKNRISNAIGFQQKGGRIERYPTQPSIEGTFTNPKNAPALSFYRQGGQPCMECGGQTKKLRRRQAGGAEMMMQDPNAMAQSQGGGEEQLMQIIAIFAEMNQVSPEEIMGQLQQMDPQQQEQAIMQMAEVVQGAMSEMQGAQQAMPPQEMMGMPEMPMAQMGMTQTADNGERSYLNKTYNFANWLKDTAFNKMQENALEEQQGMMQKGGMQKRLKKAQVGLDNQPKKTSLDNLVNDTPTSVFDPYGVSYNPNLTISPFQIQQIQQQKAIQDQYEQALANNALAASSNVANNNNKKTASSNANSNTKTETTTTGGLEKGDMRTVDGKVKVWDGTNWVDKDTSTTTTTTTTTTSADEGFREIGKKEKTAEEIQKANIVTKASGSQGTSLMNRRPYDMGMLDFGIGSIIDSLFNDPYYVAKMNIKVTDPGTGGKVIMGSDLRDKSKLTGDQMFKISYRHPGIGLDPRTGNPYIRKAVWRNIPFGEDLNSTKYDVAPVTLDQPTTSAFNDAREERRRLRRERLDERQANREAAGAEQAAAEADPLYRSAQLNPEDFYWDGEKYVSVAEEQLKEQDPLYDAATNDPDMYVWDGTKYVPKQARGGNPFKKKRLPRLQVGQQTYNYNPYQTDDDWIRAMLEFEYSKGSATGQGLSNYGYNTPIGYEYRTDSSGNPIIYKIGTNDIYQGQWQSPQNIDEAMKLYKSQYLPEINKRYGNLPMGIRERVGDFMYNTGKDYRAYMLDAYLKSQGQSGLTDRSKYNVNIFSPDYTKVQGDLDKAWNQYKDEIAKLPLDKQIELLDQGRDIYYTNINKKKDNSPSDAYGLSWQYRIKELFRQQQKNQQQQQQNQTPGNTTGTGTVTPPSAPGAIINDSLQGVNPNPYLPQYTPTTTDYSNLDPYQREALEGQVPPEYPKVFMTTDDTPLSEYVTPDIYGQDFGKQVNLPSSTTPGSTDKFQATTPWWVKTREPEVSKPEPRGRKPKGKTSGFLKSIRPPKPEAVMALFDYGANIGRTFTGDTRERAIREQLQDVTNQYQPTDQLNRGYWYKGPGQEYGTLDPTRLYAPSAQIGGTIPNDYLYLTDDEIEAIISAGGQVEFLD